MFFWQLKTQLKRITFDYCKLVCEVNDSWRFCTIVRQSVAAVDHCFQAIVQSFFRITVAHSVKVAEHMMLRLSFCSTVKRAFSSHSAVFPIFAILDPSKILDKIDGKLRPSSLPASLKSSWENGIFWSSPCFILDLKNSFLVNSFYFSFCLKSKTIWLLSF